MSTATTSQSARSPGISGQSSDPSHAEIAEFCAQFVDDPLGWLWAAYPWGEEGPLEEDQPYTWQQDMAGEMGHELSKPDSQRLSVFRQARKSGHDTGKSTYIGQVPVGWGLATMAGSKVLVTAVTDAQLVTRTAPEAHKWLAMCPAMRSVFKAQQTTITSKDPKYPDWKATFLPNSEDNPTAFQGWHNRRNRLVVAIDEASGVPRNIFKGIDESMLDKETQVIVIVTGNPNFNEGYFYDIFGRFRQYWFVGTLDSRDIPSANMTEINRLMDIYGEDGDTFRTRVKGEFPVHSSIEFISPALLLKCQEREAVSHPSDPLIVGIDVASSGINRTIVAHRKGWDCRTLKPKKMDYTIDMQKLAFQLADYFELLARETGHPPDAVFVDIGNIGSELVNQMHRLGVNVTGVQFGGEATEDARFANKRAEMIYNLREAMMLGIAFDADDDEMEVEFCRVKGDTTLKGQIILQSKKTMDTPMDLLDAYALTYAAPVTCHRAGHLNRFELMKQSAEQAHQDTHRGKKQVPGDFESLYGGRDR